MANGYRMQLCSATPSGFYVNMVLEYMEQEQYTGIIRCTPLTNMELDSQDTCSSKEYRIIFSGIIELGENLCSYTCA